MQSQQSQLELDQHHQQAVAASNEAKEKNKRNVWSEAKERALIEIVRTSKFPTPWRAKHGTTQEVWKDISQRAVVEYPEVFDSVFHWETMKEQMNRVIERQRIRRLAGDLSIKNETEVFVDEIIKHIKADDEERYADERKREERKQKRQRKSMDGSDGFAFDHTATGDHASVAVGGCLQMADEQRASYGRKISRVDDPTAPVVPTPIFTSVEQLNSFYQEREKLRIEYETQREKQRMERELERDEMQRLRDEGFIKLVGDHLHATREMFNATQNMMRKILQKLGINDEVV